MLGTIRRCCYGASSMITDDTHQETHGDFIDVHHEKEESLIPDAAVAATVTAQVYGRCYESSASRDQPAEVSSEESLPRLLDISQSDKLSPGPQDDSNDVFGGVEEENEAAEDVTVDNMESEATVGKKGSLMSVLSMASSMSIVSSASLRAALDGASSAAVSVAKSKSLRDSLQGATNTLVHASGSLFAHPLSAVAKSKRRR
eukprot:TRINITY_DN10450_c0_g1_i2.p1 TRINITY_DN10450_c0_g1~~TRINITY_DN10450_c0_g1_i2.p1  ORF type:complete len:202 (+),score=36.85 TRINITY_DN10450_c0_g1_i2:90-695(+)